MLLFTREALEIKKYQDLVKLAKEHDVYRRYAPKAELIEKLLTVNKAETLEDISMPSVMEDDGDLEVPDTELGNDHHEAPVSPVRQLSKGVENSRPSTPGRLRRRSLAGPATNPVSRSSTATPFIFGGNTAASANKDLRDSTVSSPSVTRITRQRTFDVETSDSGKGSKGPKSSTRPQLKRQGTYDVDQESSDRSKEKMENSRRKLRRQGTFDVESTQPKKSALPTPNQSRVSEANNPNNSKLSVSTPLVKRPSFTNVQKNCSTKSDPRNVITSRSKNQTAVCASSKIPTKQRVNSVVQEIEHKNAAVSMIKETGSQKKNVGPRKAPDFEAIHNKLFGKMESLVDSRRKVIERANFIREKVPKCATVTPHQVSVKAPVVRKLMSPKVGKSRIRSPKPIMKPIADVVFNASKSDNKRQSVGRMVGGVSRLSSPRVNTHPASGVSSVTKSAASQASASISNRFGFNTVAQTRMEILKEVMNRKGPVSRISPAQKTKQVHSPKLIMKPIAPVLFNASKSDKEQSVGRMVGGVSRLSSPRVNTNPAFGVSPGTKSAASQASISNHFGFNTVAQTRIEILKEIMNRKGPVSRISPAQKTRQMLQTVRLNKRFELQMKFRQNQQHS